MEEKKEKKKFNKKPLFICLAIALVFAIVGFIDIKSNAAESGKLLEVVTYNSNGAEYVDYSRILNYTEDYELYWYSPSDTFYNGYFECFLYVVSKEHSGLGNDYDYGFVMNGETYYVTILYNSSTSFDGNSYKAPRINGKVITKVDKGMYHSEFAQNYISGNIKPDVDYDNLPIDDDMPFPEKVKYNIVVDNKSGAINASLSAEVYDILSWSNTSSVYSLQLDSIPIVQYRKTKLNLNSYGVVHDDSLIKEFSGDWKTENIFSEVTNTFSKYSKGFNLALNDIVAYRFKEYCDDTYEWNVVTEESNLVFGYRLRYIDFDNEKAGPWVYLMPNSKEYSYNSYIVYSDDSTGNSENANGVVNEYTDLDNIDNAINDIVTENEFKDKYDDINSDVDTQDVTNWLYAVTDFIKSTPQVIGSVLGFLPKPILYGMYVCIYLGVIASGVAIVKALI